MCSGASKPKPATRAYHVYIIELSRNCVSEARALPPPAYVGQTANTAEYRFAQHKKGGKLAAEKTVAEAPERRGLRVFWG